MKFNNLKLVRRGGFIVQNLELLLFLISIFLLLTSCETTEPPPSNQKLTLLAEDASCTEVWLNLKTENISLPTKISINQNDSTIITANINNSDTTFFIENLFPSQTYTFQATSLQHQVSSIKIPVTTMDTTSHNFTWGTFTFGGSGGSSSLNDVAIISENDIWCVGEINIADTSQNGYTTYNAVHWDGNSWELKRIYVDYRGQPNLAPLTGVFALPDGKIIFSSGLPYLPEGDHWKLYHLWDMGILNNNDGSVSSIWGTSINDIYFAGSKGTIVHYNGSGWRKIESGITEDIQDIWGKQNSTRQSTILCISSTVYYGGTANVLSISDDTVTKLNTFGLAWSIRGLWFDSNKYYIVGSQVYQKNILSDNIWRIIRVAESDTYGYVESIRGNALNDIIAAGDFGTVLHFNGSTWYNFTQQLNLPNSVLYSVNIKGNIAVAVGTLGGGKAIAVIGIRK